MVSERSTGNLLLVLVAAALLGASFLVPWFSYDHSTGRRTPSGGFHDPAEDGVVRTHWEAGPGGTSGDGTPDDPAKVDKALGQLRLALFVAFGLLFVNGLGELPGLSRVLVRRVGLATGALAFAAIGWALYVGWYVLPKAFGHGVADPFTSFLDDGGYTMTNLRLGWVLAAFALPVVFGGWLLKFQAGAPDPTVVADLYAQGEL